ncbi:MAG TPA: alpha/beta family hydrolase [Stellaceae bacterium]|nr:alpha/beta family hydrolase [Stellaceae bacterium]
MADRFRFEVASSQHVTAMGYPAAAGNRAGVTLIIGHGAGADQTSGFMVAFATALAQRGVDIVTFNFLYSEHRRRIPDPNARLESCLRAVTETVRSRITSSAGKLALGGKSMGGRIASQVAAGDAGDLAGLVFLGYPLHPPGRPDRLRAAHLRDVKAPMLFVQGSRDAFGMPAELQPIISQLEPAADLFVIEGGDHSFKVPKSAGVKQQDVYRAIQDRIETWLRMILASRG